MSGIAGTVRFFFGLALVVGGGTLAAPLAQRILQAVTAEQRAAGGERVVPAPVSTPPHAACPDAAVIAGDPTLVPGSTPAEVAAGDPGGVFGIPLPGDAASAAPLQVGYQPPPPPAPLPPLPAEFAAGGPGIAHAYRSTLAIPPPPLLDTSRPPPLAVSWSANDRPQPAANAPQVTPAAVPATYRVRDGDDLAGIATRFYGHPGAAAAVWAANRDLVADPGLLPIGAELKLPPPWAIRVGGGGHAAIEPATGHVAPNPLAAPATAPPPRPVTPAWLTNSPGPTAPPAAAGPRPQSVRVAPGETLATLAGRLYGDPGMATRIWEVNRDRLRSPALVTAGMELRLP